MSKDGPYEDFVCLHYKTESTDAPSEERYTPLEQDLVDLAYSHSCGDRDMAYRIGQEIYAYLKKVEPEIDNWYEART